jgi:hypothetical protein
MIKLRCFGIHSSDLCRCVHYSPPTVIILMGEQILHMQELNVNKVNVHFIQKFNSHTMKFARKKS